MQRVGSCLNCGACCLVWSNLYHRFVWCDHYDPASTLHCRVYSKRPKGCREYPRSPLELERVNLKGKCGFQFITQDGAVIDPWMDKTAKLTKVKQL